MWTKKTWSHTVQSPPEPISKCFLARHLRRFARCGYLLGKQYWFISVGSIRDLCLKGLNVRDMSISSTVCCRTPSWINKGFKKKNKNIETHGSFCWIQPKNIWHQRLKDLAAMSTIFWQLVGKLFFLTLKKNLMKPCEYTVICGNLTDIMYPSIMSAPNSTLLQHFGKGVILQSTFHRVEIFSPRNNMNKTVL